MHSNNKLKIGILPIKRSFLSLEVAAQEKEKLFKVIRDIKSDIVEIIDIDNVCEKGILFKESDIDGVIRKFRDTNIDAIFICHCDFGEESVAVKVAREFNVPVLLWGNRDQYPNTWSSRGRDTQCGMFACSKVLQRNNITYSYIYNIDLYSEEFLRGYVDFLRVVNVVKNLRHSKIAQIGNRPKPFMSVIAGESTLLEKFGVEVIPISVFEIVNRVNSLISKDENTLAEAVKEMQEKYDCSKMTIDELNKIQALKMVIKALIEENGCIAGAIECWSLFPTAIGIVPCMVVSELADIGIPLSCEMDLNGALTSVIARAITLGEEPVFFADLTIRHPQNDNAELLWHCGPFPYTLRDKNKPAKIINAQASWELKKGNITIMRCDDLNGNYQLLVSEGRAIDGPETTGSYVWMEVNDWKRLEEKFIYGPYIHHVAGIYGNYENALREITRYLPVKWDDISQGPRSL